MIKGAQRRMVIIKTEQSELFEQAYFVVRRDAAVERFDMVEEANRIIDSCGVNKKRCRDTRQIKKRIILAACCFVTGGASGAAIMGILTSML